ncbi:MAG: S1C family serine protease [Planctomycetia bacterium]|nr:S1C family serine protease [Planctomycetia bacterium]
MKRTLSLRLATSVLFSFLATAFAAAQPESVRDLRDSVAPALVRIETSGGLEMVEGVPAIQISTGVFLTHDGFLVASQAAFAHSPDAILVTTFDGTRLLARYVAVDEARNLALLKVEPPEGKTFQTLPIAPKEKSRPGSTVLAFGRVLHPQNLSVTSGIVSAVRRIHSLAIQTDAFVSPDNYGGPLVNLDAEALAIITPLSPVAHGALAGSEIYDSGVGFAIPIQDIYAQLDEWKTRSFRRAPALGIVFDNPNPALAGTKIFRVQEKSLAEQSGLRTQDRILSANGVALSRGEDLQAVLARAHEGDRLELSVQRGKETLQIQILLQKPDVPSEPKVEER